MNEKKKQTNLKLLYQVGAQKIKGSTKNQNEGFLEHRLQMLDEGTPKIIIYKNKISSV